MTASTPLIIVTAVVIVLALTLLFLVNQPLRKRVGSFFGFSIENDYLLHIKTDEELAVLKKKQEQDTKKQFTRTQRIAKNGLWSFIQMFTTSLLSFIVRTMAIYYFTSQIFGISSTLGSYITIVNMIEFGITGSFTYRLSKAYHDKDIEKATIITQAIRRFNFVFFLIALGLGIILSFLLPVLIYEWNQDSLPISQTGIYILFFILLIPKILHFLTNNNHLLIYIDEKSRVVARYSIVIGVICHLLQIASFFIFKDAPIESQLYIYFGLMMVMTISTYIVSFWYSRKHYKVYYQHTKAKLSEKESRFLQRDISTSFTNKAFKMLHDFFVTFCRSTLVLSLVIGAFDTYSYIITL
ncbi:MAG: hypothetical protein LBR37_01605, partial [Erysipelotrichaceae bacterium]|nr:hypothetical protein [Erysipelotrichaceae bacterium]